MLSKKLQDAINEQINAELYSAYVYLSMAAYFEDQNLPGFAHWMRLQHDEEQVHAMKLFDFLVDRGARVVLKAIDAPPVEFESPLQVFEAALEHERKVTGLINDLYGLALEEGDYPTQVLLQWFISEQVEEEKSADDIVQQLRLVGDYPPGLLMLDREMAARQPESEETEA
ncbi:MAG: ferritin [Caldilineae bacterium]|nr:MAG: ferritin [Caldilineae bacterium]